MKNETIGKIHKLPYNNGDDVTISYDYLCKINLSIQAACKGFYNSKLKQTFGPIPSPLLYGSFKIYNNYF